MGEDNEYRRFVGDKLDNWNSISHGAPYFAGREIKYAEWTEAQTHTSTYKKQYPKEYEPNYAFAGRLLIPRLYKTRFTMRERRDKDEGPKVSPEQSVKRSRLSGVSNGAKRGKTVALASRTCLSSPVKSASSHQKARLARSGPPTSSISSDGFWSRLKNNVRSSDNLRQRQASQQAINRRSALLLVVGVLGLVMLLVAFSILFPSSTRRSSATIPSRPYLPSFVAALGKNTDATPLGLLLSQAASALELPATAWGLAQPTTSPSSFAYIWKVPRASGLIDTVSVAGEELTLKEYSWVSYEEQNDIMPIWDEEEVAEPEQIALSVREFVYALLPEQELLLDAQIYLVEQEPGEEYFYTFLFPWQSTGGAQDSGIAVAYDLRWQRVTRLRVIDPN